EAHLVREVRSQGVGKICAVGTKIDFSVFVEAEMVEQEIARGVAHHLVQRRPRRLRIERIVEQLLDPGGEQVLACAIPGVAQGPGAPRRRARPAPAPEPGPPGLSGRPLISRVIGPHPAPACWGVSVACQEPAAGALISASQKYGGPPWRSREVAATLPSGPVSESSP